MKTVCSKKKKESSCTVVSGKLEGEVHTCIVKLPTMKRRKYNRQGRSDLSEVLTFCNNIESLKEQRVG